MRVGDRIPGIIRQSICLTLFVLLLGSTGGRLFAQVTANFTSNVTSGCSPVVVSFNSTTSTGTITSWLWDLGNGNTSTVQNPTDIYSIPGTYTVTLTVTGVGGSDTRMMVNYITVFQRPDVIIGASPQSGCVPLGVQFTNNSIAYPGPFTSLIWDFGDGNTSNSANPLHTYSVPGTYNVLLSTIDNNGCAATNSVPTTINVSTPINANFSFGLVGSCGAPVTANFTDISTGTGPFTYSWDFGDGSPLATTQNPSHTYLANGSYTVTLIIDNGVGCQDTLVVPNAITISALNANFSAAPTQVCVGDPVVFSDLTTGGPLGWDWDFGDGGFFECPKSKSCLRCAGFLFGRIDQYTRSGLRRYGRADKFDRSIADSDSQFFSDEQYRLQCAPDCQFYRLVCWRGELAVEFRGWKYFEFAFAFTHLYRQWNLFSQPHGDGAERLYAYGHTKQLGADHSTRREFQFCGHSGGLYAEDDQFHRSQYDDIPLDCWLGMGFR
jgi:PKD repeat protein